MAIFDFIKNLFGGGQTGDRKEGTVKFFNTRKGFGFITVNDTEEEIFAHTTNIIDKIKEGNKVTFEIEQGEKGPSAVKVRLAK